MPLTKVKISDENFCKDMYDNLSISIKSYINTYGHQKGIYIEDYQGNIHYINEKECGKFDFIEKIPIYFDNNIIYVSPNSFQQNHKYLSKKIRKYVLDILETSQNTKILCIGGESYMYALSSDKTKYIFHMTNSEYIHDDLIYNTRKNIYFNYNLNKEIYNSLVDYSSLDLSKTFYEYSNLNINNSNIHRKNSSQYYDIAILNLSKLHKNIINQLNSLNIKKIIIINCHHDDFWKKIKNLTNYTLLSRIKFICDKLSYFITVNVLIKKDSYISLGSNCAIAHQLNNLNIRNLSMPFDWCKTKLLKLIMVFQNDFSKFADLGIENIKKISENHPHFETGEPSFILKNYYGIEFAHELVKLDNNDGNNNDIINLEKILSNFSSKVSNRIERFKQLENPTFIRLELEVFKNMQKMFDLYRILFLELNIEFENYRILVITRQCKEIIEYIKNTENDFLLDKFKFINLDEKNKSFEDWTYNNIDWKSIILYN